MAAGVIMETPPAGRRGSYSVVAEDELLLEEPPVGAAVVAAAEPDELPDLLEVVFVAEVDDCLFVEDWEDAELVCDVFGAVVEADETVDKVS